MTANPLQLVKTLLDHSVPLVVIGGHAVNCYGFARATEDTDIIFRRSTSSEQSLLEALVSINAFWISDEIDPATGIEKTIDVDLRYIQSHRLMMVGTDLGYLDIFDFIPGLEGKSTEVAFQDTHLVNGLPYVSLSLLREMKRASGRTIDLLDLENLPEAIDE